jgi:hypothetical protein
VAIAASLALNVALAAWWIHLASRHPAAGLVSEKSAAPKLAGYRSAKPDPPGKTPAVPPFRWSDVESTDYRQYIANLRAIGCPEATIRDLIVADLNGLYSARMQAIWQRPVWVYWKKSRNSSPTPDQVRQLMALDREKAGILKELLGITANVQELIDTVYLQTWGSGHELLFLPADKREAALQVLTESGFAERLAKFQELNQGMPPGRDLFAEELKILAPVLSPTELEEFRLRHSPTAQQLRNEVAYLNCTPAEFKELMDLREQDLGPAAANLGVDHAIAVDEIRKLLGDDRARDFERVSDMGYFNVHAAADRAGLPADLADQAGQIAYDLRTAAELIARNTTLSTEERQRQVQALMAPAEARLEAALGDQAGAAIRVNLRNVLTMTAQPIKP